MSAVLPPQDRATALARLRALPGVAQVELRGDRVRLRAADSDAAARTLLGELRAVDLQIGAESLEGAFLAITEAHRRPLADAEVAR